MTATAPYSEAETYCEQVSNTYHKLCSEAPLWRAHKKRQSHMSLSRSAVLICATAALKQGGQLGLAAAPGQHPSFGTMEQGKGGSSNIGSTSSCSPLRSYFPAQQVTLLGMTCVRSIP